MTTLPELNIDRARKCRIPRPEKSENNRSLLRRSNSFHIASTIQQPKNALFSRATSLTDCDPRSPIKTRPPSFLELPEESNTNFRPRSVTESFGSCISLELTANASRNNLHKYCHSPSTKNVCHCQFRYNSQEYVTPTQRFQRDIHRLNKLIEKMNQELEVKTNENIELRKHISDLKQMIPHENKCFPDSSALRSSSRSSSKTSDSGNCELENGIKKTEAETHSIKCDLSSFTIEAAGIRINELENQIQTMQQQQYEQEQKHHHTYLQMYKKGQEAAKFQHADEVLEFAHQAPNRVSVPELLKQLHLTEQELNQMKNLYRVDIYKKGKQFCDAEISLRFLKDAIYYYLTDKNNKHHLAAIENIAGFSECQKMSIQKALLTR